MAVRDRIPWLQLTASKPGKPASDEPWWVTFFTDFGRPAVAVIVMTMCAPGEHHLGVLAGWSDWLAWGMAAVLAAYAGIAAVVATRRPKGTRGRASAILGAVVSLIAAMAAQPVSHLFVTGWLSSVPRTPLWLVIIVSCVPPLVLGHLLHLAAAHSMPQPEQVEQTETRAEPATIEQAAAPTAQPVSLSKPAPALTARITMPVSTAMREIENKVSSTADGLLTTRDVAALKGVSTSTVGTWVSRNKLTPVVRDERLGNLFDPASLN